MTPSKWLTWKWWPNPEPLSKGPAQLALAASEKMWQWEKYALAQSKQQKNYILHPSIPSSIHPSIQKPLFSVQAAFVRAEADWALMFFSSKVQIDPKKPSFFFIYHRLQTVVLHTGSLFARASSLLVHMIGVVFFLDQPDKIWHLQLTYV